MRRTLGTLSAAAVTWLAVGVITGCGSSSSTATDPADTPRSSPSRSPGTVEGAKVLPLISMTGAGGPAQSTATVLDTRADVMRFAKQLRVPAMSHRIVSEAGDELGVPGHDLVGQIVMVGCDRPPGADVMVDQEGDVVLVPHEVASPLEECLAPVTTVALAVLPST